MCVQIQEQEEHMISRDYPGKWQQKTCLILRGPQVD